jgi:hypothetical protein
MVAMTRWIQGWREIARDLADGVYVSITANPAAQEGRRFEVLRVSKFDQEVDGAKNAVLTPSSRFEDSTALLCHLTRDAGIVRVITTKGRPWFILEPGEDVLQWAAAIEGVTRAELLVATRSGVLWQRIAKRAKREKKAAALAKLRALELESQLADAEDEVNRLRAAVRLERQEVG